MGPASIGVEVQRNTDGDTPSIRPSDRMFADKYFYLMLLRRSFTDLNLNSLLVKRQIDNPSPGAVTGGN